MKSSMINSNAQNFGVWDYGIFISLLLLSLAIGIYFGFISKRLKTVEEYLLGGRRLKTIPVGISLVVSQITAMTIMTNPSEIYAFGTQYYMMAPIMILPVLIINYVFIPIYYNNQISNCYEYLEMRFNGNVRKFVSIIFLFQYILWLPIIMYVPSLALSHVTGYNIHLINTVVTSVCVLYTMMGGMKAIIWTDVLQGIVMMGSSIIIMILAVDSVGGIHKVWTIAVGSRLEFFNMKLDLTTRYTFWNVALSNSLGWTAFIGLNQNCVQRIASMSSMTHARRALWVFVIGYFCIQTITVLFGISMYAKYADCDLLEAKVVDKLDKMVPYFVQDIAGHITGITGIFISCVLSASLSTMSGYLNSISGVIYYDHIARYNLFTPTDRNVNRFLKLFAVIIGIYSILAGFIVVEFKSLIPLSYTITSISEGITFGIFILGMLWPNCNSKGVLTGGIAGFLILLWIAVGCQVKTFNGEFDYKQLPASIEGCEAIGVNVTKILVNSTVPITLGDSFSIYKIAFLWYALIGGGITIIVGVVVSLCTGGSDYTNLQPRLFPPCIHWILLDKIKSKDIKLNIVNNRSEEYQQISNK